MLYNILDHLPLGCDTILDKNHGVPDGTVVSADYSPKRHPKHSVFEAWMDSGEVFFRKWMAFRNIVSYCTP
jgi:hypothetical protein